MEAFQGTEHVETIKNERLDENFEETYVCICCLEQFKELPNLADPKLTVEDLKLLDSSWTMLRY